MNLFRAISLLLVLMFASSSLGAGLIEGCRFVYKVFRKRACFDKGRAVVYSYGDYYCCPDVTEREMLSMGASAWWLKDHGFCGRSSCDNCNQQQDCVVFTDDDIFCCTHNYFQDKEPESRSQQSQESSNNGEGSQSSITPHQSQSATIDPADETTRSPSKA